jgi:hypothetical protein
MTLLHRLASIVRWMVRRNSAERDLNDELQAFVDMAAADSMREGAPSAEARRLAVLHLGGVEQAKERVRTARHGAWLDDVGRDVRYGLRVCARNPRFSAIVIMTLALSIGANTAMCAWMTCRTQCDVFATDGWRTGVHGYSGSLIGRATSLSIRC